MIGRYISFIFFCFFYAYSAYGQVEVLLDTNPSAAKKLIDKKLISSNGISEDSLLNLQFSKAIIYSHLGLYEVAESIFKTQLEDPYVNGFPILKTKISLAYCSHLLQRGHKLEAKRIFKTLENDRPERVDDIRINWLITRALLSDDSKEQVASFREAILLCNKIDNTKLMIDALVPLGAIYRTKLNDNSKCLQTLLKADSISHKNNFLKGIGKVSVELSTYYRKLGEIEASIDYATTAIHTYEKIDFEQGLSQAYVTLSNVLLRLQNWEQCRELSEKAEKIAIRHGQDRLLASIYLNTPNYIDSNSISIPNLKKAIKIAQEIGDKHVEAFASYNLAYDYQEAQEYFLSDSLYRNTYDLFIAAGELTNISWVVPQIVKLNMEWEENKPEDYKIRTGPNDWEELLLEALDQANKSQDFRAQEKIYDFLVQLYDDRNQIVKANYHKTAYIQIQKEGFERSKVEAAQTLATQFETNEKEKEIIGLEAEKKVISARSRLWGLASVFLASILILGSYLFAQLRKTRKQLENNNIELKKLNSTKDRFFGIIAHDIRSPILALESVDEQMNYYADKGDVPKVQKLSGLVGSTARQLNTLLDNLLNWALLQTGMIPYRPEEINVYDLAEETLSLLSANASVKGIQLENRINKEHLIHADPTAIRTILRNLIGNSVKFTSKGDKITIASKKIENKIEISIKDTGIGMTKAQTNTLFSLDKKSKQGTSGEKGTGLGLILVKELVALNKGCFTVESELGEGTSVKIAF